MENASKALIIAGGVLVSLIILSLLVTFFSNIRNLRQTEQTGDAIVQAAEFNKQYEAYNRTVYGSEILSLADKIEDYNKREADSKDYQEISITIIISKDIDKDYFPAGTYEIKRNANKQVINDLQNAVDNLNDDINTVGNAPVTVIGESRKIPLSTIASARDRDIQENYKVNLDEEIRVRILGKDYRYPVRTLKNKYNDLKSTLTNLKSTRFKSNKFTYDQNNGRVVNMEFQTI